MLSKHKCTCNKNGGSSRKKPTVLGIKDWFQYAKDHGLLITVENLYDLLKPRNKLWDNSTYVQNVHAIDQSLLKESESQKTYDPTKFFTVKEKWMHIQKPERKVYNLKEKNKTAQYVPMWSIIDGVDYMMNEKDHRIQFDRNKKGEWGYLAWDDGDDAFTRYMTYEQLLQMPQIKLDGSWPDR